MKVLWRLQFPAWTLAPWIVRIAEVLQGETESGHYGHGAIQEILYLPGIPSQGSGLLSLF